MPYTTIREAAQSSVTIEKSEFIAKISPVTTSEEAAAFIESVRSEHRRARHNCYAYTLREGFETRYSDDGEPQGTAGPPILDVIQKNGLTDVCVVVTRYFGGILLGKGGLTRAYSSAASGALSAAKLKVMCDAKDCLIDFEYSFYERILRELSEHEIKLISQDFGERVSLKLLVKEEKCGEFEKALRELSLGKITPNFSETYYADFGEE